MGVRFIMPMITWLQNGLQHRLTTYPLTELREKRLYNIGLGYFDQQGLINQPKEDDFKRYNATTKLSTELNKYITVRTGYLFSQRTKVIHILQVSTTADPWLYLYRWGPLQPFWNRWKRKHREVLRLKLHKQTQPRNGPITQILTSEQL